MAQKLTESAIPGTTEYLENNKSASPSVSPLNGNGTLGQTFNLQKCGLNYVSASQKLGKRYTPAGVNQPAPFVISGIPACAVIERAYFYIETSGSGMAVNATVVNPAATSQVFPMTMIGNGPDKCWGYGGSYTYRADVTSIVTGNGTYTVSGIPTNPPISTDDADGGTLFIIYSDPTANYRGHIVLHDGMVVVNGGTTTQTVTGINACSNSTLARAFAIVADFQMAPTGVTLNGTNAPVTWDWYNYIEVNTTITNAQATANMTVTSSGDCYGFFMTGIYYQTTSCVTCPSAASSMTATTTQTNVTCFGGTNGSATVTPSGGSGTYTYAWSPSGGTGQTATGLSAGTYTVTVTDGGCGTVTKTVTITQPPSMTITGSQTNVSCNAGSNGSATGTPSGGSPVYTYSWSPSGGSGATATGLAAGTYVLTVTDGNGCTATRSYTITQPTAITVTASQTNVNCNGGSNGSASVIPSGGTGTYTYSWSPSGGTAATASGLSAGNYTVTITDANGCVRTQAFTITQPTALITTGSQTNVSCNGGSNGTATVSVSGGVSGYSYSWSPSGGTGATASGLSAGSYTVTVTDANGCTATRSFTITAPTALSATQAQTNVACNGGSDGTATVTVSGGTGTYTYSWSPSGGSAATATGLSAGSYTVTITDAAGCSMTSTFNISAAGSITSTQSQTNVSCNGGSDGTATVTATGGTGAFTYSWSPSGGSASTATGLSAGTYTVFISDAAGCSYNTSVTITEPTALSVVQSQLNVSCNGGSNGSASVTVSGGTAGYTYSWSPSGGSAATASGLSAGSYTATITDAKGCMITSTFTISEPVALAVTSTQSNVSCNGGTDGTATVTATGGTGAYTYSWSPSGGTSATATNLGAGTHSVSITDANGCSISTTVTITEPVALSVVQSQTNVTCNGGSDGTATVTVTGGTGSYTYSWSPSGGTSSTATGLSAGSYIATVTDAEGCLITSTFTITSPTAVSGTETHTDVSCFGGSDGTATIVATGGTGSYSYSWSPSGGTSATATGLAAGTYVVNITDVSGCTGTVSVTIAEPVVLSKVKSQLNVSCYGGADGAASVVVSGGTPAYTYSWVPVGGSAATATGLSAGTYGVVITDSKGCQDTAVFIISQPDSISVSHTSVNVSCFAGADGSATVNVTGGTGTYTYSWSPAGGTSATATGLAAGSYLVTVTDANNCTATENITITEPSELVATQAQSDVLCNGGSTGVASVAPTGGTGSYTYSWTPNVSSTDTANGLSAGAYTVVITDANGCTVTKNFTITEPVPLTSTQSQVDVICTGNSTGSATVTVSGGTGSYTYSWTPAVSASATAVNLSAGTYIVETFDSNGCSITDTFAITEPAGMVAAQAQSNVLCHGGSTGSASISVTGGSGIYSYVWSPSVSTSDTALNLFAGSYSVTVSDTGGCTLTKSFVITEPDSLTTTGSQTNVLCNGDSTGTATVTATGGTGAYTYSWSPNTESSSSANGLSVGTYQVMVTDSNGCSTTHSFTITEPAVLTTTLTPGSSTCSLPNGSAIANVSGGASPYTYSWNSSPVQTDDTLSGVMAGTYLVQVTDTNGCIDTASVTITDNPSPIVTITSVTNATCYGDNDGSATVSYTGGTAPFTVEWNTSPVQTDTTATGLAAGTYQVVVTDMNGCADSTDATITEPPAVIVDLTTSELVICYGSSAQLNAGATGGQGGDYSFTWNNSLPDTTAHTVSPTQQTLYTVYATDTAGCSSVADSITIMVREPLQGTSDISVPAVCLGEEVTVTVTMTGGSGNYIYSWSTGDASSSVTDIPSSSTTYDVTVTDQCGVMTFTESVIVHQPPVLNAGRDTTIVIGNSANLYASPGLTYNWIPGFTLDNPSSSNPVATPEETTLYIVTGTDQYGCMSADSVKVIVEIRNDVFVPSAFSPNGDGENDVLYVRGTAIRSINFLVFDRWGHKVFESTDKAKGWDGTLKGSMMNTAVFVYYLEATFLDGEVRVLKGDVTLIR